MAKLTATCQVSDILAAYPTEWTPESLVAALRPVTGRVYSIASSPAAVGDEVHLTVAVVGSDTDRKLLPGAASNFVVHTPADSKVQVWIERNDRFRVPADGSRDIIMVGPGTGVAPFRGFVQERAEAGASGRNWLFFGAQHFNTGFLYQVEWQEALRNKELHRLDLAFSRDQAGKVYVQQRLRERGAEVYDWLQNGAHFYVNDASLTGDEFTTAAGDNANDGKSPDRPMASLAALLSAYDLNPDDVIHVDAGAYAMVRNAVITAQDAGVRIKGPASAVALLNRANTATGSYAIELVNADGVTDFFVINQDVGGVTQLSDGRQVTAVINAATGASVSRFLVEHATNSANVILRVCGSDLGLTINQAGLPMIADFRATSWYFGGDESHLGPFVVTPGGEQFAGSVPGDTIGFGQSAVLAWEAFEPLAPYFSEHQGLLLITNSDFGATSRGGATGESEAIVLLK